MQRFVHGGAKKAHAAYGHSPSAGGRTQMALTFACFTRARLWDVLACTQALQGMLGF